MQFGTLVEFIDGPYTGRKGIIEGIHPSNGTYQIRISAGQEGAGRIVSANDEYIVSVEDESPSYEPKNIEEIPLVSTEPKQDLKKMLRKFIVYTGIIIIMVIILWGSIVPRKQEPKSFLEQKTERLNQLNIEDIQDIEACKRFEIRKREKIQILNDIQKYKNTLTK